MTADVSAHESWALTPEEREQTFAELRAPDPVSWQRQPESDPLPSEEGTGGYWAVATESRSCPWIWVRAPSPPHHSKTSRSSTPRSEPSAAASSQTSTSVPASRGCSAQIAAASQMRSA